MIESYEQFNVEEYLRPVLDRLESATTHKGRVTFSRLRSEKPYDQIDWLGLYEEGSIIAEYAEDEIARQGIVKSEQIEEIDTLIGDINRMGAVIEVEDENYVRLARLDNDRLSSVIQGIISPAG